MKYKTFGEKYVLRLEKGEELVETIKSFAAENDIKLGTIYGLGAVNDITVGLFDTDKNVYQSADFCRDFEIVSLIGNITTMNGKVYLHLHGSFADAEYRIIGGHINKAVISATAELVIEKINGEVDRHFDEKIGLNLLSLD